MEDVDGVRGHVCGRSAAELLLDGSGARLLSDLPPPGSGSGHVLSELFVCVLATPQKLWIRKSDAEAFTKVLRNRHYHVYYDIVNCPDKISATGRYR